MAGGECCQKCDGLSQKLESVLLKDMEVITAQGVDTTKQEVLGTAEDMLDPESSPKHPRLAHNGDEDRSTNSSGNYTYVNSYNGRKPYYPDPPKHPCFAHNGDEDRSSGVYTYDGMIMKPYYPKPLDPEHSPKHRDEDPSTNSTAYDGMIMKPYYPDPLDPEHSPKHPRFAHNGDDEDCSTNSSGNYTYEGMIMKPYYPDPLHPEPSPKHHVDRSINASGSSGIYTYVDTYNGRKPYYPDPADLLKRPRFVPPPCCLDCCLDCCLSH